MSTTPGPGLSVDETRGVNGNRHCIPLYSTEIGYIRKRRDFPL